MEKPYLNVPVAMLHVKKLVMTHVLDAEYYVKMVVRRIVVEDVLADVKRYAKLIVSVIVIQNAKDYAANVPIHV